MPAQAPVVARSGRRSPQKPCPGVYGLNDCCHKKDKSRHGARGLHLVILHERFGRIQQIETGIGRKRPVNVLAGAIDAVERLFVQERLHAMAIGHLVYGFHNELICISGYIRLRIDTGYFKLIGRHLVVLCLGRNAHGPELSVEFGHKCCDFFFDRTVVVILQLLTLCGHRAHDGTPGKNEIRPLLEEFCIDKKVLLLWSDTGVHSIHLMLTQKAQDSSGDFTESVHGPQEWHLLVQGITVVRNVGGWNAKRQA